MKNILFFKLKSVCYNSYSYFIDSIALQFQKKDCMLYFFDIEKEPLENLERLLECSFDAIIDFNSDLPKLKMDDDTYFLDHINAPFYDIILDHPLYHHDMLKQTLRNFHVICLDYNHKAYISTYYPHIRSVHVLFMTGETHTPVIPYKKRSTELLFTGTYTPSKEVFTAISNTPPFLAADTRNIIDLLLKDSSLTIEGAAKKLAPDTTSLIFENFPLHLQAYFLADTYVRSYQREEVLSFLLKGKFPLTICGHGWEGASFYNSPYLTVKKSIPFFDTFALMADSKMVLNLMPNFKNGTHDRIFSAMLNHCVTITDESVCLKEQFIHEKDIVFYNLNDLSSLAKSITTLQSDLTAAASIAEHGYQKASHFRTWSNFADLLYRNIF